MSMNKEKLYINNREKFKTKEKQKRECNENGLKKKEIHNKK